MKHSTYGSPALLIVALTVSTAGCNQMNSQALNAEGVRLYMNGNYPQAAEKFEQAIADDPRSATSYYNLASSKHKSGKLYNRSNDLTQAEQLYNQCLDYDANDAECHRGLAVLLCETGRQDAAYRLLEGWAERSPQLAAPHIELARLMEETNNKQQASLQLVQAITIEPNNTRALTALGKLREQSGDQAQALANYQRSLAINRFQPEVEARVAALQATHGGPAMASATPTPPIARTVQQQSPQVRY
jgi:tetratricopeptide (TPR) repeat protein